MSLCWCTIFPTRSLMGRRSFGSMSCSSTGATTSRLCLWATRRIWRGGERSPRRMPRRTPSRTGSCSSRCRQRAATACRSSSSRPPSPPPTPPPTPAERPPDQTRPSTWTRPTGPRREHKPEERRGRSLALAGVGCEQGPVPARGKIHDSLAGHVKLLVRSGASKLCAWRRLKNDICLICNRFNHLQLRESIKKLRSSHK
mmetsp:Transcript_29421/g.59320  ORF Transcript_29421/g.59320 Transcript_29421/m.59320 type:complete len:200 (+) Transcript_29421:265-864(+)